MDQDDDFDLYGDGLVENADPTLGIVEPEDVTETVAPQASTQATSSRLTPAPAPAPIDEPVPNVLPGQDALCLTELHWWTSDDDIKQAALAARVNIDFDDITFNEVKATGKSRGMVYIACRSDEDAARLRNWFGSNEFQGIRPLVAATSSARGNPYRQNGRGAGPGPGQGVGMPGAPSGPRNFVTRGRGRGGMRGGMQGAGGMQHMGMGVPLMMPQMGMMGMGMGMPGMGMGMGMPGMGIGQNQMGQPAFNPAFFGQNGQSGQDGDRKRPRTE